jgi:adhesin/invasin
MRTARFLSLALAVGALAACGPDTDIGPGEVSLAVSPPTLTLVLTDPGTRLVAVATDSRGITFVVANAMWSSDGPGVATVDASGLVQAVGVGSATITARAGAKQATASVTVTPAPVIATSVDSVGFSGIANGPAPASQVVAIANGGGGTLFPVTDSVAYGAGASGWLQATLTGPTAPDTLQLAVATTALAFGTYSATVTLQAAKAIDHVVQVTLTVGPGAPAQVVRQAGDSQSAIANTAVPIAPAVKVIDAFSNPVPGTIVQFVVTSGGGSLGQGADTTDASGAASPGSWTLGASAGTNHFTATVSGLPVLQFTAIGNPGNAVNLLKTSGDGQSDPVAATLGTVYTVRVTDGSGNGVQGVTVAWSVPAGTGSITPAAPQTDASGFSTATRKLGTVSGTDSTTAAVGGLVGSPITFTATANPGHPATLVLNAGNGQYATVDSNVAVAPSVAVRDGFGNGVSGIGITFAVAANNGTIGSATPTTNASGIATLGFWTMGAARRTDTLTATPTSISLSGSPVRFTAHAAWSLHDQVQPQVFTAICAGCHTAGPSPDFRNDSATYKNLLNGNGTATVYVTPFDTTDDGFTKTHGFLLFRLKSASNPMPPGAGGPLATTNPALYALIRDWILDGARR